MIMYVDGSYCQYSGEAGIGIYVPGSLEYHLKINAKGSLEAELIACLTAASIAKPYDKIVSDCQIIIKAFKKNKLLKNHEKLSFKLYKKLKSKQLKILWQKRTNTFSLLANKLANTARKKVDKLQLFKEI